jgi:hypothetical protein
LKIKERKVSFLLLLREKKRCINFSFFCLSYLGSGGHGVHLLVGHDLQRRVPGGAGLGDELGELLRGDDGDALDRGELLCFGSGGVGGGRGFVGSCSSISISGVHRRGRRLLGGGGGSEDDGGLGGGDDLLDRGRHRGDVSGSSFGSSSIGCSSFRGHPPRDRADGGRGGRRLVQGGLHLVGPGSGGLRGSRDGGVRGSSRVGDGDGGERVAGSVGEGGLLEGFWF